MHPRAQHARWPVHPMHEFQILTMSCGHGVRGITPAVLGATATATATAMSKATVELPTHLAQVQTPLRREAALKRLAEAGLVA